MPLPGRNIAPHCYGCAKSEERWRVMRWSATRYECMLMLQSVVHVWPVSLKSKCQVLFKRLVIMIIIIAISVELVLKAASIPFHKRQSLCSWIWVQIVLRCGVKCYMLMCGWSLGWSFKMVVFNHICTDWCQQFQCEVSFHYSFLDQPSYWRKFICIYTEIKCMCWIFVITYKCAISQGYISSFVWLPLMNRVSIPTFVHSGNIFRSVQIPMCNYGFWVETVRKLWQDIHKVHGYASLLWNEWLCFITCFSFFSY